MKKLIYILPFLFLTLFSCQNEDYYEQESNEVSGDRTTVKFSLSIPEYRINRTKAASYENSVNDLSLLVFDANGLFLERVQATDLLSDENNGRGSGTFKASLPNNASIIHYIANYDWSSFNEGNAKNKDEREILPALATNKLVFWGRNVITSLSAPVNITLYRNQAKVTIENQAANFQVTGYALGNYITTGSVAPFNPQGTPTPFILMDNATTLPVGQLEKESQTSSDCDMTPKYMFENNNIFTDQTYVIIKGRLDSGQELYYKIQYLDSNKQPYIIMRNYNYKISIRSFSEAAIGSTTFNGAKTSEPSNNIYAEINKESPTIADDNNNILTVGNVNYLFIQGGQLNIDAHYTKNGTPADNEIQVSVVEDPNRILQVVQYTGGKITGNVSVVLAGQQEATILVKAGKLTRTITITSSALYKFDPTSFSPSAYTVKDQTMALNFNIPSTIPSYLYPIKCEISTQKLYPTEPNKDLEVEYVNGIYKYIYWATSAGNKVLNFKTSFDNSDETVTIQNPYFETASIDVKARHFANLSVNQNNLVNYKSGSTAAIRFIIADLPEAPASYPLTVKITTNNLQPAASETEWTAVSGGYTHTYNSAPVGEQTVQFVSNKDISYETITVSANGFSPSSLFVDNVLGNIYYLAGIVRQIYNGNSYRLENRQVNSNNTSVADGFNTGVGSGYYIEIKTGSRLHDIITFSTGGLYASFTVESLMNLNNGTLEFK
ncbi:hypothetical protein [Prevotella sp. 10(H)]|uniref:hypothetical protein n=1 Tax=Prevotella sp. 10(H) TaxID=1158294 RepID=UPI0004A76F22|nr:hypothetical protein [Prevotella sp. 10(H)]